MEIRTVSTQYTRDFKKLKVIYFYNILGNKNAKDTLANEALTDVT